MTKPTKIVPHLFVSADLGAGNIKLYSKNREGFPAFYPSVISYVDGEKYYEGVEKILPPDLFYCVRSTNERVHGLNWFTGSSVLDRPNLKASDPGKEPILKVENALPLFLSALIENELIEEGETNIVAVASHHDARNLGSAVKAELVGAHEIVFNKKRYKLQVKMPEEAVIVEGGALVIPEKDSFISMDLGYLTSLLLVHGKKGSISRTQPEKTGVNLLVTKICDDDELRREIGGVSPSREAVVKAIQNPVLNPKTQKPQIFYRFEGTNKDITSIYKRILLDWVKEAMYPVKRLMQTSGSETLVCIGGGTKLPYITDLLKKMNIPTFADYGMDPLYANVISLYEKHLEPELVNENRCLSFEFPNFERSFPKLNVAA